MYGVTLFFVIFVLAVTIVYGPLVFMNVVFTFSALPGTDVPFYNSYNSLGVPQYGTEWWFLALDMWRPVPVLLILMVLSFPSSIHNDGGTWATVWQVLVGLTGFGLELVKAGYWTWLAIFYNTSNIDNCYTGAPNSCFNVVFWLILIFAWVFVVFFGIFAFSLPSTIEKYRLSLANKQK